MPALGRCHGGPAVPPTALPGGGAPRGGEASGGSDGSDGRGGSGGSDGSSGSDDSGGGAQTRGYGGGLAPGSSPNDGGGCGKGGKEPWGLGARSLGYLVRVTPLSGAATRQHGGGAPRPEPATRAGGPSDEASVAPPPAPPTHRSPAGWSTRGQTLRPSAASSPPLPPLSRPSSPPPHPPLAHSVVRCCTCPIFCFTRPSPAIDSPPGASTLRPAPLPSAARWGSHAVRALLRVFGFGALGTVASERTGPAARWWWRGAVALNPSPGSHHRHHLLPACRARARGRQPRALRPCVAARSGRVPVGDTLYHTLVHASSRRGTPTRPAGGLLGQVPGDRGLMLAGSRP